MASEHITGFEVSGHSGYSKSGSDIVCAAVSGITLTTLGGLKDVLKIQVSPKMDEETGYLKVILPLNMKDEDFYETDILLKTMCEGLKSIAHQFSKFISYSEQEV